MMTYYDNQLKATGRKNQKHFISLLHTSFGWTDSELRHSIAWTGLTNTCFICYMYFWYTLEIITTIDVAAHIAIIITSPILVHDTDRHRHRAHLAGSRESVQRGLIIPTIWWWLWNRSTRWNSLPTPSFRPQFILILQHEHIKWN